MGLPVKNESTTRESLGVFWKGEEVDGFTLYGYWPASSVPAPTVGFDGWPLGTEHKISRLVGESWTVWVWDVKVSSWPSVGRWRRLVTGLLDQLIASKALVAWGASEGTFVDPPCLFDPRRTGNGVWTARSNQGDAFDPSDLDGAFRTLTSQELVKLRTAVGMGPCPDRH